jgi:hypothetical protein
MLIRGILLEMGIWSRGDFLHYVIARNEAIANCVYPTLAIAGIIIESF